MDKPLFITGIIMIVLVSPLLLYIRFYLVAYQNGVMKNGIKTKGIIRRVASSKQGPIIRYLTDDHQEYTLQYPFYKPSMRNKYTVLEEVTIFYDQRKPNRYLLENETVLKWMIHLTTLGVIITIVIGIIIIFL